MRDNIEQASAFKVRHTAPQYSILTVTLTASYTIAADSPNVLFLDGGLSARDVYLPAIVPGGGQEIKIFNTGTVDLTIRDAGGVSILVLQTAQSGEFISKSDSWASIKYATLTIGVDVQAYSARLTELANISWAQGDIVYYNGSSLVKLAAGTSGHFLKTQGPGANPLWAAVGGASLADGDYGDIVVSGSGTAMTIDTAVVTYAKIQNVSATDRLLGRSTAGAGVVEEITCTAAGRALIDDVDAATQCTTLGLGTASNPQFATIELGAASDTTLSRSSAGVLAVEGVTVPLNSITNIHTAQQIELGHASDTTLTRSSAGILAVEGVTVSLNSTSSVHIASTIELGAASDTTLSRSAAGILAVEGVDQARVAGNQNLTGGFTGTSYSGGTVTGSNQTYTPNCANVNIQHITLNGSSLTGTFTFAVPTVTGGDCGQVIVEVVNGGSGAVGATLSASGYTRADTTAYNTTNGNKFLFVATKTKNYSYLQVVALQ